MNSTTENACKYLDSLNRFDLSGILQVCSTSLEQAEIFDGPYLDLTEEAIVEAPVNIAEGLRCLPNVDRKRIAQSIASAFHDRDAPDDITIKTSSLQSNSYAADTLAELLIHRHMMIDVATGGNSIQEVNDFYISRELRLRNQFGEDSEYQNPHEDLWSWYHFWKENFGTWSSRREHVKKLFGPIISTISKRSNLHSEPRTLTGWERVDRTLVKARKQLESANDEEDHQAIGLLCREVLISLAQAVYDPKIHEPESEIKISKTDAKRMIEAYINSVMSGGSNKEVRQHAKASLALALNLQHRRTATLQLARLCVEATASTAAVIQIIAGEIDSN